MAIAASGAILAAVPGSGLAEQRSGAPSDDPQAPPVSAETLSRGVTSAPFEIKAKGPRKTLYRKAVVQPGASTGWHYHVGEEIAVIHSGTFTRIDADGCTVREYGPGESLVEPVGPGTVHMGVNRGTGPVVLYVVDLIPTGATAPTVPAPGPGPGPGCGTG